MWCHIAHKKLRSGPVCRDYGTCTTAGQHPATALHSPGSWENITFFKLRTDTYCSDVLLAWVGFFTAPQ